MAMTELWDVSVECVNLGKPKGHSSTGIGYLDHMLDQFTSHAQIGLAVTVVGQQSSGDDDNVNRHAECDQVGLLNQVGIDVGKQFGKLVAAVPMSSTSSTFLCPLDEALVTCRLERSDKGSLKSFSLAPYGCFPKNGRKFIGKLRTEAIESFFQGVSQTSGLTITIGKLRGHNAHHVCESCFKAVSRALRNLLDGVDTVVADGSAAESALEALYGAQSANIKASVDLQRTGSVERKTKETSIEIAQTMDGGSNGIEISTGLSTLDRFWKILAQAAKLSLTIKCKGDVWIDDHHTAEDVSIAVGQVWDKALGTKAGLNRMWCAEVRGIRVTMDLSNRPCLTHNLTLDNGADEMIGEDLSIEMFDHVLDSLVVNGRWTVHIEELEQAPSMEAMVDNVAAALGKALYYASAVDCRRAGATASSKGTLSV